MALKAVRKANFIAAQQNPVRPGPYFYLRRTVFRLFYKPSMKTVKVWYDGRPDWTVLVKE